MRGAVHAGRGSQPTPFDDVIAEIAELAGQGVCEINLLGQNVNAYRGPMHGGGTADLALLIHYVSHIEGDSNGFVLPLRIRWSFPTA